LVQQEEVTRRVVQALFLSLRASPDQAWSGLLASLHGGLQ
jgi:hypothetical protein